MKKLRSPIAIHIAGLMLIVFACLGMGYVSAAPQIVDVTAQVGAGPAAPSITAVTPADDPILVAPDNTKNIIFTVSSPNAPASISWTASVISGDGSLAPISGTITPYPASNTANFDFLAPGAAFWGTMSVVRITINDGVGPVFTKDLNVLIF